MRRILAVTLVLTIVAAFALPAIAALIVDTDYTTDTDVGTNTQFFLEGETGGTTATWDIDPGVTVTGGRYFIGSVADPDDGPATFVVTGGGTLEIDRVGTFNMRFGQGELGNRALGDRRWLLGLDDRRHSQRVPTEGRLEHHAVGRGQHVPVCRHLG